MSKMFAMLLSLLTLTPLAALPRDLVVGTDEGLYRVEAGRRRLLWDGGSVRKIVRAGGEWFTLGGAGIFASADLSRWEERNAGLPVKTIKIFENGEKSFRPMIQEIKDLEADPADPSTLVCATKDQVFLSRDGGRSWKSLGMPPYRTNGIKAAAAAALGGELTVFLSHSTYGVHYLKAEKPGAVWTELNTGLETLETTGNADEVSDIAVRLTGGEPEIFAAQTFRRRIYKLDTAKMAFNMIWKDDGPFGTVDSLCPKSGGLYAVSEGRILAVNGGGDTDAVVFTDYELLGVLGNSGLKANCAAVERPAAAGRPAEQILLSELWLLDEPAAAAAAKPPAAKPAFGKNGIYLPVNHAADPADLQPYLDLMAERGLTMAVIDMKDDYGRLRFTPEDGEIKAKGRVFRPLDIDKLLQTMKAHGIYTAARVVVFKDPVLAAKEGGRYAVWDARLGKPWAGYRDTRQKKGTGLGGEREDLAEIIEITGDTENEILRRYYDERWVDPFSEVVWDYTARVAAELYRRGFDEIQFDYIRFPTDGANLGDARYRWQENGMDMESAIYSFLRHIRGRLSAPISIDIYGANGWYRTGARTGQEVELLAPWVDVICPMYYPSHFEQDFLAQPPAEERPYRIYYLGTLRTSRIGRGKIIVRPYAQAFYLNVSYDRRYYNTDYTRREQEGVRDAGSPGLTWWNNSGRYADVPGSRPSD